MAIVSNVSKYPIELASEDGDTCMIPVGKNIPIADKFLANVLPGIKIVSGQVPVRQIKVVQKPSAEEQSNTEDKSNMEEQSTPSGKSSKKNKQEAVSEDF